MQPDEAYEVEAEVEESHEPEVKVEVVPLEGVFFNDLLSGSDTRYSVRHLAGWEGEAVSQ